MTPKPAAGTLGLIMALSLVATACGGGHSGPGVATLSGASQAANHPTTTAAPNRRNATELLHDWANCMRQHGLQMADPTIDAQGQVNVSISGGNLSTQSFQAADTACQSLHNEAMTALGGGTSGSKPDATKLLAYSRCMRAHGVPDFPDPNASGGLQLSGGPGSDLDPNNPAFQAAQRVCQPVLGNVGGAMRVQVNNGGGSGSGGVVTGSKP